MQSDLAQAASNSYRGHQDYSVWNNNTIIFPRLCLYYLYVIPLYVSATKVVSIGMHGYLWIQKTYTHSKGNKY